MESSPLVCRELLGHCQLALPSWRGWAAVAHCIFWTWTSTAESQQGVSLCIPLSRHQGLIFRSSALPFPLPYPPRPPPGVPRETFEGERRVALTPAGVAALHKAGFKGVVVEASAGALANFGVRVALRLLCSQLQLSAMLLPNLGLRRPPICACRHWHPAAASVNISTC